jgi:uncharacterized Ntn-hydrolase superfamily protein
MTYTVLARCPRTGHVGIGVATYSICVGLYCDGLQSRIGATMTQAFVNQGNNTLALDLLRQGFAPARIIEELALNDPFHDYRQIAVIDREGTVAAFTGPKTRGWAGHVIGEGCVAFGNVLAGPEVVDAIAVGYTAEPDAPLEHRLLRALEYGRDAGGQRGAQGHLTERSAALLVFSDFAYADLDLRVDLHERAVDELRRCFEEYQPYRAYYRERGRHPQDAVPQDVFVSRLAARGPAAGRSAEAGR